MKQQRVRWLMVVIVALCLFFLSAQILEAVSDNTVCIGNVIGTAVGTLVKGCIQGKVHSFKDAIKCLGYGSIAGYGFYLAKDMVADGKVVPAILVGNLALSICDNVSSGVHPLAFLSFSLPLVHFQVATPLARHADGIIRVGVAPLDAFRMISTFTEADRVKFKDGMLTFTANEAYRSDVIGWSIGLMPTVLEGQKEGVYHHEVIHVLQNLQLSAVSPEPFAKHKDAKGKRKLFVFGGIRLQAIDVINGLSMRNIQGYDRNWREVEAYHFAY